LDVKYDLKTTFDFAEAVTDIKEIVSKRESLPAAMGIDKSAAIEQKSARQCEEGSLENFLSLTPLLRQTQSASASFA
jgi:hypothetical protein